MSSKKSTLRHNIIKLLKAGKKEKIYLEATRENNRPTNSNDSIFFIIRIVNSGCDINFLE